MRLEVFICHPHCGVCSSSVSRRVACFLSPISSRPVCVDGMALSNLGITNAPHASLTLPTHWCYPASRQGPQAASLLRITQLTSLPCWSLITWNYHHLPPRN